MLDDQNYNLVIYSQNGKQNSVGKKMSSWVNQQYYDDFLIK